MKAIPTGHHREVWSLDRSQKSQIFQRTAQTQWTTSKIVFKVIRLQLHIIPHTREDKYQGWYFIKEELSRYQGRQQRYSDAQGQNMDKKNIIAEVTIIQRNQVVEETILLEEIQRNNTKEQKVLKELEKDEEQAWKDDEIVYVEERIYIPNNQRI